VSERKFDPKKSILLVVGIVIIAVMVLKIGIADIVDSIASVNPYYLIAAFALLFIGTGARIVRWHYLFRELSFRDATKIFLGGQLINLIAPMGTGELARVYMAKTYYGVDVGKTLAATLVEKLIEITLIFALAIVSFALFLQGTINNVYLLLPLFILLAGYAILLRPSSINYLISLMERLEHKRYIGKLMKRVIKNIHSLEDALLAFRGKKAAMVIAIFTTMMAVTCAGLSLTVVLLAFGYQIDPLHAIVILSASIIVGIFTFLPGGLGSREITSLLLLEALGIDSGSSPNLVAAILVFRILTDLRTGTTGFLGFITLPKAARRPNDEPE
jgi:uncharacterized protein (TIRG00374 family)